MGGVRKKIKNIHISRKRMKEFHCDYLNKIFFIFILPGTNLSCFHPYDDANGYNDGVVLLMRISRILINWD